MFNFTKGPVPVEIKTQKLNPGWTYPDLDARQRQIAAGVRRGEGGALLLSEVAPIITQGRRTPAQDLLASQQLNRLGISVHSTDRGGLATYHCPGQWVIFPVDSLEALVGDRRGVRKGVGALLNLALRVGQQYSSGAHIRQGCELGVWTDRGKFAAVGIHIEQGVLLHGLAVNGYRTSSSFQGIRPCGLDLPVDFLLKEPSLKETSLETSNEEFEDLGNRIVKEAFQCLWY